MPLLHTTTTSRRTELSRMEFEASSGAIFRIPKQEPAYQAPDDMVRLKRTRRALSWVAAAAVALLTSIEATPDAHAAARRVVDGKALISAADDLTDWLTHGRTYDEQRFSPLDRINTGNVKSVGLAWFADLDTARGQEATPLVIDGAVYITTAWSKVKAYEAVSGKLLWEYDPKVPGEAGVLACCDVVNRGLAAWDHRLYLGTLDGRLIALDRETGTLIWSKLTVDRSKPYGITGAPRVIDGRVIIGNGGAEMGVRGYVAAYDSNDGKELWRFYTVPDRRGANVARHLKRAEATWKGEWWTLGGGGTVWDSMAYDPKLDLLYVGVGNGSPQALAQVNLNSERHDVIDQALRRHPRNHGLRHRPGAPGLSPEHVLHVADEAREPRALQGERACVSRCVAHERGSEARGARPGLQSNDLTRRQHLLPCQIVRDRRQELPVRRRADGRHVAGGLRQDDARGRTRPRRLRAAPPWAEDSDARSALLRSAGPATHVGAGARAGRAQAARSLQRDLRQRPARVLRRSDNHTQHTASAHRCAESRDHGSRAVRGGRSPRGGDRRPHHRGSRCGRTGGDLRPVPALRDRSVRPLSIARHPGIQPCRRLGRVHGREATHGTRPSARRHGAAGRADRATRDRVAHGESLCGECRTDGRHTRRRPDRRGRLPDTAAARSGGHRRGSVAGAARGASRPRRETVARSDRVRCGGGNPRSHQWPRCGCLDRRGGGAPD